VTEPDPRLCYPATARNRDAILSVLRDVLPERGRVLEIASGSGEHSAYFAPHFPSLTWQPTDLDPGVLPSIAGHAAASGAANIAPPMVLDVTVRPWPVGDAAAILAANMIHIAPWAVCEALIAGAAEILTTDGILFLYGPYRRDGAHTAPSNERFDVSLRSRNADWGVRDLEAVSDAAAAQGLTLHAVHDMPSNNLSVIFRRDR
jgi:uncharacterized protein DUF938